MSPWRASEGHAGAHRPLGFPDELGTWWTRPNAKGRRPFRAPPYSSPPPRTRGSNDGGGAFTAAPALRASGADSHKRTGLFGEPAGFFAGGRCQSCEPAVEPCPSLRRPGCGIGGWTGAPGNYQVAPGADPGEQVLMRKRPLVGERHTGPVGVARFEGGAGDAGGLPL